MNVQARQALGTGRYTRLELQGFHHVALAEYLRGVHNLFGRQPVASYFGRLQSAVLQPRAGHFQLGQLVGQFERQLHAVGLHTRRHRRQRPYPCGPAAQHYVVALDFIADVGAPKHFVEDFAQRAVVCVHRYFHAVEQA